MDRHYYSHKDCHITYFGRNLIQDEKTYCNWTCSGFQFECIGKKVEAEWFVDLVEENGQVLYPWFAVFINDATKPYKLIELNGETNWYTLYESNVEKKVQIKVIKRTEAQHSKTALKRLVVEGKDYLGKLPLTGKHRIEFIGDSITCGYGNETNRPEDGFKTQQENGLMTYAAQVARRFEADFQCVSVSGIGIYSSYTGVDKRNDHLLMKMVYNDTDYFVETASQDEPQVEWDFKQFIPELIVINLGTNDRSYLQYDYEGRKEAFKKAYVDFLKQVRNKNGKTPKILCATGAMAPNIYDSIVEAVHEYTRETQDKQIQTMVFDDQREEDGIGGSWHPTVKTHTRMAEKMIEVISNWLEWE